jgi:hypothetical protein
MLIDDGDYRESKDPNYEIVSKEVNSEGIAPLYHLA